MSIVVTRSVEQKRPEPIRDPAYLAHIRSLPCAVCRREGETEAAHCRLGWHTMGQKPGDDCVTPLCAPCHRLQHKGELKFWVGVMMTYRDLLTKALLAWRRADYEDWKDG